MLCWFLLYNNMNQLYIYIYPIPPFQVITKQYSLFQVAVSLQLSILTHDSVCIYIYINVSLSICPPFPFPTVSTSPFCMFASLFLPCKQVHQYHSSRFCIYELIYICVSLSDFTLNNSLQVYPTDYYGLKFIPFDGYVVFHCIYISQFDPFIC